MDIEQLTQRLTHLETLFRLHKHQVFDGTPKIGQLIKKNSGGPITSSGVVLDTAQITGIKANDVLVIVVTCTGTGGTSTGAISLQNTTDATALGNVAADTTGVAAGNTAMSVTYLTVGADGLTRFIVKNTYNNASNSGGADTVSRDRFTTVTGNNANFDGGWTLALYKGTDSNGCNLYWRWCVYKLA